MGCAEKKRMHCATGAPPRRAHARSARDASVGTIKPGAEVSSGARALLCSRSVPHWPLDRAGEAAGNGVVDGLNLPKNIVYSLYEYITCGYPSRWPLPRQQCASHTDCMLARSNAAAVLSVAGRI